ncbi:MAG: UDP-N-acetylglucosamine 2-epimerase (non-hydrolyzing) [Thermoanaerobacteraceae bacterium]|jgi:UDP-N-acetylglucosamine 2-epimerase (non-hydrolysing)|nr:UDP-N-acetylglucosamine 2-epimerase (non-hydrolyzing) [Thermoanaerobacteraceae bacterium]
MKQTPQKVLIVFGTRPEAIKMAPVIQALRTADDFFRVTVAVTAQHREMLDQVLRLFDIVPEYDLNIMREDQTLFEVTARVLQELEPVLREVRPDIVLVHGDTTTTFAAALAAFYLKIAVGHVEAGLRTGEKYAPFPEEINRRLAAVLTDLHFAPTVRARTALLQEGIAPEKILVTGNTVIDALYQVVRSDHRFEDPVVAAAVESGHRLLLVTTHRRENWGEPLASVYRALKRLVLAYPDVAVVFPVHRNPLVRQTVREVFTACPRVYLTEPLSYGEFANLMARSFLVLTDSGGLQEEAPALGKPVLVLRAVTERPEALEAGTVELVGTGEECVFNAAARLLSDSEAYRRMAAAVNPYGDGRAAERITAGLRNYFGLGPRPDEFSPACSVGHKVFQVPVGERKNF